MAGRPLDYRALRISHQQFHGIARRAGLNP
jgi:hypothetical protein